MGAGASRTSTKQQRPPADGREAERGRVVDGGKETNRRSASGRKKHHDRHRKHRRKKTKRRESYHRHEKVDYYTDASSKCSDSAAVEAEGVADNLKCREEGSFYNEADEPSSSNKEVSTAYDGSSLQQSFTKLSMHQPVGRAQGTQPRRRSRQSTAVSNARDPLQNGRESFPAAARRWRSASNDEVARRQWTGKSEVHRSSKSEGASQLRRLDLRRTSQPSKAATRLPAGVLAGKGEEPSSLPAWFNKFEFVLQSYAADLEEADGTINTCFDTNEVEPEKRSQHFAEQAAARQAIVRHCLLVLSEREKDVFSALETVLNSLCSGSPETLFLSCVRFLKKRTDFVERMGQYDAMRDEETFETENFIATQAARLAKRHQAITKKIVVQEPKVPNQTEGRKAASVCYEGTASSPLLTFDAGTSDLRISFHDRSWGSTRNLSCDGGPFHSERHSIRASAAREDAADLRHSIELLQPVEEGSSLVDVEERWHPPSNGEQSLAKASCKAAETPHSARDPVYPRVSLAMEVHDPRRTQQSHSRRMSADSLQEKSKLVQQVERAARNIYDAIFIVDSASVIHAAKDELDMLGRGGSSALQGLRLTDFFATGIQQLKDALSTSADLPENVSLAAAISSFSNLTVANNNEQTSPPRCATEVNAVAGREELPLPFRLIGASLKLDPSIQIAGCNCFVFVCMLSVRKTSRKLFFCGLRGMPLAVESPRALYDLTGCLPLRMNKETQTDSPGLVPCMGPFIRICAKLAEKRSNEGSRDSEQLLTRILGIKYQWYLSSFKHILSHHFDVSHLRCAAGGKGGLESIPSLDTGHAVEVLEWLYRLGTTQPSENAANVAIALSPTLTASSFDDPLLLYCVADMMWMAERLAHCCPVSMAVDIRDVESFPVAESTQLAGVTRLGIYIQASFTASLVEQEWSPSASFAELWLAKKGSSLVWRPTNDTISIQAFVVV